MNYKNTILFVSYLMITLLLINCSGTKATIISEKTVKIYNSEAIRHYMNGEIYSMNGNYPMAVLEYQDALKFDSTSSTIYSSLGNAYIQIGKINNAKKLLSKAVEIDSANFHARKQLTDIIYSESNFELAEKEYNKLPKVIFDNLDIDYKLADIYLRTNRIADALKTYEDIFRKDRSQIGALERAAEILFLSKNFDKASIYFDFLIQIDPNNTEYLKTRADLAIITHDVDKSIEIYKKLLILLPEDKKIQTNLGEILSQLSDEKHSPLNYLNSMVKKDSSNINNYKNLIFYHINNNQMKNAIFLLNTTINKFPKNAEFYFILGSLYREKKEVEKALVSLDSALVYAKNTMEILQMKATILEESGKYNLSDSLYNYLIDTHPEDPVSLNNFAYSLATREKELDFALEMVNKALKLVPNNASYLDTKGWILYKQKKYPEAEEYLNKAYKVIGDNAEILEHLGDIMLKQNKLEEAQEYYRKALELDTNNEQLKQKIKQ